MLRRKAFEKRVYDDRRCRRAGDAHRDLLPSLSSRLFGETGRRPSLFGHVSGESNACTSGLQMVVRPQEATTDLHFIFPWCVAEEAF